MMFNFPLTLAVQVICWLVPIGQVSPPFGVWTVMFPVTERLSVAVLVRAPLVPCAVNE